MSRELLGLALLGGALLVPLRARLGPPRDLRLAPPNDWVLARICRSAAEVVRWGPRLERVQIDLSSLLTIGDSSVALLETACRQWRAAGARVTVVGCCRRVRSSLLSLGSSELRRALGAGPQDAG
jgi:hypothetical protein